MLFVCGIILGLVMGLTLGIYLTTKIDDGSL